MSIFTELLFVTVRHAYVQKPRSHDEGTNALFEGDIGHSVSFLQMIVIFGKTHAHNTNYPRQERIFSLVLEYGK